MKISIIMACLNGAKHLKRALNSVLVQTCPDYEIIVQDGGSTDGSLDVLKAYGGRIDLLSEPDSGIYDAWNRALERASGDWALFLGADDMLVNEKALEQSRVWLEQAPEHVTFVYGNLALGIDGRPKTKITSSLAAVYSGFLLGYGLPFPATFTRLGALREHGFDASFRIAGDFDLESRLLTEDNVRHMPHFVTFMEHGGISDNPRHAPQLLAERRRVLKSHVLPKAGLIAAACLKYLGGDPGLGE